MVVHVFHCNRYIILNVLHAFLELSLLFRNLFDDLLLVNHALVNLICDLLVPLGELVDSFAAVRVIITESHFLVESAYVFVASECLKEVIDVLVFKLEKLRVDNLRWLLLLLLLWLLEEASLGSRTAKETSARRICGGWLSASKEGRAWLG